MIMEKADLLISFSGSGGPECELATALEMTTPAIEQTTTGNTNQDNHSGCSTRK